MRSYFFGLVSGLVLCGVMLSCGRAWADPPVPVLAARLVLAEPRQILRPENAAYGSPKVIRFADMESLHWNADGKSLSMQFEPVPQQSMMLFRNGILQTGGGDFMTRANVIFPLDPQPTDMYVVWYRY